MIDIGANLAHDSFDHDFNDVLQRAKDSAIEQILVTGSSEDSSEKALELARQHPGFLFATAGMHPHHASDFTPTAMSTFRSPQVYHTGKERHSISPYRTRRLQPRLLQQLRKGS